MTAILSILRAGPLTSIQDEGRMGMLRHGISASGPMDRYGFDIAGLLAGGGHGALECTMTGFELKVASGRCVTGFAGGDFVLRHNGKARPWPGSVTLESGDVLSVSPGQSGNYGYVRFDCDIGVEPMMGSISTSSRARLGGLEGRSLRAGDVLELRTKSRAALFAGPPQAERSSTKIRVIWGLHADLFASELRQQFFGATFRVSTGLDRMGVRLEDPDQIFVDTTILSLASDAVVPGDIQILGDGTPIVLMRDHQPTGGYPRIATVITADFGRFAQMRPGTPVAFEPVTVEHAHQLLRSR